MLKRLEDLTPEQQEVVRQFGKGQAVLAGAGTGKTTTLVIKCEELIRRRPEARFAAVSFTEKSASELKIKLIERGVLSGLGGADGHWVTTIHGLCAMVLREFPRHAGLDGEETVLTEPEAQALWEQVIDSLWFQDLSGGESPLWLKSLEFLLTRESRASLKSLLKRVKELSSFGALSLMEKASDPETQALRALAEYVLSKYEGLKRRRGVLDFDDLERAADRALSSDQVREAYHRRFDLVLIDEFQDTNPVQARILWRVAKKDLSNLCVVGDPKQSIYRFRDADVSVFEEYCSRLPIRQSLTWNFRSRPPVIEFVNQACERLFEVSELPYERLTAKRDAPEEASPPSVARLKLDEPEDLAAWVAEEQARGTPLGDMVLLLRKVRGSEKWLKPLAASGIPVAVGSGGFFWDDPRIREIVAFLSWWDLPSQTLSGLAFLRAPWVGVPDAELDRWVKEDPTWVAPFFSSAHPLAERLRPLRDQCVSAGDLVLRLLEDEDAERELGMAALGLWHRLEELSVRGLDFHSSVRELRRAVEDSHKERDVPPPAGLGQLRVMTLHASKGLEFPIVILADFEGPWRSPGMPLLFWDRKTGVYLGKRASDGKRQDKDPEESLWRTEEKRKSVCESKRLFYVALTRARERLVLAWPKESKSSDKTPDERLLLDDWRSWVELSGASLAELAISPDRVPLGRAETKTMSPPSLKKPGSSPRRYRPRHSVTEWNLILRCARAYEWRHIRAPSEYYSGLEFELETTAASDPRMLGTRVHGILEKLGKSPGSEIDEELKRLEAEAGSDLFQSKPLLDWIETSELLLPAQEGKREVWTELGFEVPIPETRPAEILIGSIDRLVCDLSGAEPVYDLIDYKVTASPKPRSELLFSYGLQIQLYSWALQALEPEARGRTRAWLLNIHPGGVQAEKVDLEPWVTRSDAAQTSPIPRLLENVSLILSGTAGSARTGAHCYYCEFKHACAEGKEATKS